MSAAPIAVRAEMLSQADHFDASGYEWLAKIAADLRAAVAHDDVAAMARFAEDRARIEDRFAVEAAERAAAWRTEAARLSQKEAA